MVELSYGLVVMVLYITPHSLIMKLNIMVRIVQVVVVELFSYMVTLQKIVLILL